MDQTAVVQVDRYVPHRLYGKRVRVTKKFFAHDQDNSCTVGDVVEMTSIPPKSKRKTFKISKVVTKSDF
jgi:small subunit ribosomal protein S17